MTDHLNIIFDDFGIWLLGCGIEFGCLYIPHGHYCIGTLWVWRTDDFLIFIFKR